MPNTEYASMTGQFAAARDIDQTASVLEGGGLIGGSRLSRSWRVPVCSIPLNIPSITALGYVSLKSGLQTDQVLAVAYEYTYGVTYQVGEFASDITDTKQGSLREVAQEYQSNNPRAG